MSEPKRARLFWEYLMAWGVEYTDEFASAVRSIGRSDPVTKSFKKFRNEMPASRQARIAARTDELLATLPLHEIRQARKLSQEELAARLHVNQAAVSKAEHRTDLYISTLRRHIEAMGGTLIIQAEFPEGRYQLETFGRIAEEGAD